MKANFRNKRLSPSRFVYGDVPDPEPGRGELLIEVKAASINPVDYKLMNMDTRFLSRTRLPRIVGSDFAGIVRKAADGNGSFRVGDRVYGTTPIVFGKPGSLAEFLVTDAGNARLMPDNLTFEEAAALPVAALTALNGLRRCGIVPGMQLLVNGATGGVGHFAVQIARAKGAIVTASCSPANQSLARQLGANHLIGYHREALSSVQGSFDAVLDAWGHLPLGVALRLLRKGGTYASTMILAAPTGVTAPLRFFTGRNITSSNARKRPEDYGEIERLLLDGQLKPVIENRFPLSSANEAFTLAMKGRPRGKVVVWM